MSRAARFVRLSLLLAAAGAAILIAKQGRDYKALAGLLGLLAALTALATAASPFSLLRTALPSASRLTRLWACTLVPVGTYAIAQRLGHDPIEEFAKFNSDSRPFSTFGNPDFLGVHTAFLLPLLLGRMSRSPRPLAKLAWLAFVGFDLLLLLWTGSRGAWLGAIIGTSLWFSLTLTKEDAIDMYRSVRMGLPVLALISFLFISFLPQIMNVLQRRTDRIPLWEGTLRMIRVHPVLGWGPGRFAAEYPPFAPPQFAARMKADNTFAEHPHSEYLQAAVDSGVVGLGLFLWLLAAVLRRARLLIRDRDPVAAGVLAAFVAVLVHVAVDRNFRLASTAVPFWLLAASLFRKPGSGSGSGRPWIIWAALPITLALGALALKPCVASWRVEQQGDFLKQATEVASSVLAAQVGTRGKDPNFWVQLGNVRAKEGRFGPAADAFKNALALDPAFPSAANNLGNCYFMQSRFDEAAVVYRGMLARDPRQEDARFNLAFTYYHQRRIKEALAELDTLLRQNPANPKAIALKEQLRP